MTHHILRMTAEDLAASETFAAHSRVEQAIAAAPTGPVRELLTSINIQLQVVHNAIRGVHDGEAECVKLNALLAGEAAPTPTES